MVDLDMLFPRLSFWAEQIGAAVWIRDPEGRLCHLNSRAEALLNRKRADWEGKRCHEAVASRDERGEPFCGPKCQIVRQSEDGMEIQPVEVQVRVFHDGFHWVRVLVVPIKLDRTGSVWLMHCAISTEREHQMRRFLMRVAERAMAADEPALGRRDGRSRRHRAAQKRLQTLSRRELQILDFLVEDRSLPSIAAELGLSRVTVRNHVQHVLRKLGVHSTLEAVAVRLVAASERMGPM